MFTVQVTLWNTGIYNMESCDVIDYLKVLSDSNVLKWEIRNGYAWFVSPTIDNIQGKKKTGKATINNKFKSPVHAEYY
jgi:hypothetical protein